MDHLAQRDEAVAGALAAQSRLVEDLAGLTDEQARSASLLPDWSVGHVLTHIARNGDSFVRMMSAAIEGQAVTQYDGGPERRVSDIAAGAGRSAADLIADVTTSATAVEDVFSRMTAEAWVGHGLNAGGDVWPCEAMPYHRWREVAIHHVDLGLGYTSADWPDDYLARELSISLKLLPERLDDADRRRLLRWLIGRGPQPADLSLATWQARPDHYLR